MEIGGEAERDLGSLQECCCSSHQQQQGRWSRRSSSSIQLVILLFWLHSLLCTLAFLSVAVAAEVPADAPLSRRITLAALNNTQTPNAADAAGTTQQIPSSPPPQISSSSSATGGGPSPSPVDKSPASAPSRNPSSPAPNHAPTTHINSTSGAAPPVSASPRFNSEEKAGIILAAFAALLQVVVVTYLLAKRRQMLGMVCDYDPPERSWENPAFSRSWLTKQSRISLAPLVFCNKLSYNSFLHPSDRHKNHPLDLKKQPCGRFGLLWIACSSSSFSSSSPFEILPFSSSHCLHTSMCVHVCLFSISHFLHNDKQASILARVHLGDEDHSFRFADSLICNHQVGFSITYTLSPLCWMQIWSLIMT